MILGKLSSTGRNLILILGGIFLVYTVVGFFVVPLVAKKQLQDGIEKQLGTRPAIANIKFNPFTFVTVIEGFDLPAVPGTPEMKSRLHFQSLLVNAEIFGLLKNEVHLKQLVMKEVDGQFVVFKNGQINWQIKKVKEDSQKTAKEEDGKPWVVRVDSLQIDHSGFEVLDYTHLQPLHLPLGPVTLRASKISTSIGSSSDVNIIELAVGEQGHLKISGSAKMNPLTADLNLDFVGMPMGFLTAYLSDRTYLQLGQGHLDLIGKLKYQNGVVQFTGDTKIHDLSIEHTEDQEEVLSWKLLDAKSVVVNSKPLSLKVADVTVEDPSTAIVLQRNGILNYTEWFNKLCLKSSQNEKKRK